MPTYYYQIQLQLEVCKLSYCDFVVWTVTKIVVERIAANNQFISTMMDSVHDIFVYGTLPEIVGKWYTRKLIANSEGVVPTPTSKILTEKEKKIDECEDMSKLWCCCNEPSLGEMIQCDN